MADDDTKDDSDQQDSEQETDHSPEAAQVGTSDGDGDSG
jgi:hypothetical protein